MAGVDSTGFVAKTFTEAQDEMASDIRGAISPALNLSETSLLGQYVSVTASQIRQLWEAAQAIYAGSDVDQAEGDRLEALCRLTGTIKRAATYSTAKLSVTLSVLGGAPAGTYGAGTLIVHVIGDPTSVFTNDVAVTVISDSTVNNVAFTATELGPVRANANALTVIASPVTGFSAPTNPAEALLGLAIESDYDLRLRQKTELARRGATTVDAIRADILQVPDVTYCSVTENEALYTVDSIPGKAFEVVVIGGDPQALFDAVWLAKPAGIQAYGTTAGTAVDTQGFSHDVGITRPDEIVIKLDISVTVLGGQYAGDTALKQALSDWADGSLQVGHDVIHKRVVAVIMGVAGVVDCTVGIGLAFGGPSANYVIGAREYATVDQGNIQVVQTVISGAP